ncbi:UTRA domain-containing protein [Microvirga sp. VF16]|uniref:UTRA domain-containing protein n=1 Tax=Microvirga sp. VF16 TaxID=2807101 RepID=UPI00193DC5BB|nr:UTRA domain-containing protein [Microvirga sp. VF16]QRM35046.1 UTRA domain-containing protein [Microvirga sp. VF16]
MTSGSPEALDGGDALAERLRSALIAEGRAGALEAEAGSPALLVVRRYLDRKADLLEFTVSVHPADRYVVSSSLRRIVEAA